MRKVVVDVPHVGVEDKNGDVVLTVGVAQAVISQETTMALIYALGSAYYEAQGALGGGLPGMPGRRYSDEPLNQLRDAALKIAVEHGFTDASVGEDIALMHSELSEALEDYRAGKKPDEVWYELKGAGGELLASASAPLAFDPESRKPCGVPSEMADVIIRVLHFCGKHGIDIEKAVREKMAYNASRPHRHGGKKL